MKFKATILLLYSSIAFINIPFVESSALRKGWHSVHTKIDAVFNVTQFMNCVNINGTIINLWETEVGEYLVTPANLEVFELFKWLDCTDEQDIGDLLVVAMSEKKGGGNPKIKTRIILRKSKFSHISNIFLGVCILAVVSQQSGFSGVAAITFRLQVLYTLNEGCATIRLNFAAVKLFV
ncbi:predicted protein [Scheffersomyces stipitis CBS 6054]|uniref:Uncharacterized protein n=1 Tax=Scheffersomyces stipitis (strain ATCC 58785 / CBS 6054 / NBRC 10063 / NRRL Y-11545) TaxID=322104 RepID=A3GI19_PICST|nr:predicted protein [Scheffersomyces stipitis CBS 6054]EAZ62912.2 predicted protein [Scheffersomyces stipitis CBS 6054]